MNDKHADTSSGQVELDGFIGEWIARDGWMKVTCLTAGAPPKEATEASNRQRIAAPVRHFPREGNPPIGAAVAALLDAGASPSPSISRRKPIETLWISRSVVKEMCTHCCIRYKNSLRWSGDKNDSCKAWHGVRVVHTEADVSG